MGPASSSTISVASPLTTQINWNVETDTNSSIAVQGAVALACKIGTPLTLTPDVAIQACDRYFYIDGKPNNPHVDVKRWIDGIRSEVESLWTFDSTNNTLFHNPSLHLSSEHFTKSGELFAQGLAIEFLANRLNIPRQKLFFYDGSEARPDFTIRRKNKHARGILCNGLWGLEVRLRSSTATVGAEERTKLTSKKSNGRFKGVIAIYVMHGKGTHRNGLSHTRIHVVDPSNPEDLEVPGEEILPGVLSYFIGLTSQVGLWEYRDHLASSLERIRSNGFNLEGEAQIPALIFATNQVRTGIVRTVLGRSCRGREFNDLIFDVSEQFTTRKELERARNIARARMQNSDFGTIWFRGIDVAVLKIIEENRWIELGDYVGPNLNDEQSWVRPDGLACSESPVIPGSPEAQNIEGSIPT